jgi:CMP-N-acetylneuraminic acid synthetase
MLNGLPLLAYSINFAKLLNVDAILCTTDSAEYAELALNHGAEVLGLRSPGASSSHSMENHVIDDLNTKMLEFNFVQPQIAVWLRPTFVFRSLPQTSLAIADLVSNDYSASRVVTEVDPRIYKAENDLLVPATGDASVSMIRRQGLAPYFHVYNVDVFRWPTKICSEKFLGDKVGYRVAPKICGVDIDNLEDLNIAEALIRGGVNPIVN